MRTRPDPTARPHCLKCRRPMQCREATGKNRALWYCARCRVACTRLYINGRAPFGAAARPHCVTCRREMYAGDRGRFRCPGCGAGVSATAKRLHVRRRDVERPVCPACGRPKVINGRKGKQRFYCLHCYRHRLRLRERPGAAMELRARIYSALPGHLAPDERDDAAQSIILDILAGKLAPVVPEPRVLRAYAAAARGMTSDRFRFVSLSQPTRDGREFGETLAA